MGIPQYDGVTDQGPKPTTNTTDQVVARFGRLHLLDDLIRLRAADYIQHPILAYPKPSQNGSVSYEYFNGQDLDCMIDYAVCTLMDYGFKPVCDEALHFNRNADNLPGPERRSNGCSFHTIRSQHGDHFLRP